MESAVKGRHEPFNQSNFFFQDPHQYLNKELESWELWNLDESRPIKLQMRDMAEKWVKDWNLRFQVSACINIVLAFTEKKKFLKNLRFEYRRAVLKITLRLLKN